MIIIINVDGISIAMGQHCGLDPLIITEVKNMDQEKKLDNMFTQETMLALLWT